MYHNLTCIQFIQHSTEKDFVTILKNPTGCWSSLGRIGGKQILNLQSPMCLLKVGTTIHELMHVLGFNHEHTREDRDEYVEINWKNIPTDSYRNFGKSTPNSTDTFNIKYDYESVLHYSPFAFAMDLFKPTLVPLKKIGLSKMGQRDGLSKLDISKIWKMYKCKTTTENLRKNNKNTRFRYYT
ncbi:hatching enzyme 1.2-like [Episyrphus balteatus]|uniref:hatching enzyme 1.2-like n=1 Tax=Episyrphus balteatus TaxID=286459 RepID=UPI002484F4BD|nr:hatching enzyme 1.2-like [Episyrphus balteatus]